MSATLVSAPDRTVRAGEGSPVDRRRFEQALQDCVQAVPIDLAASVLIVGGSYRDANLLYRVGFRRIALSNIEPLANVENIPLDGAELTLLDADLEHLALADETYDLVLAHEVLHHCHSPHKALLEMLRVSRRHVVLMEPNDSLLMRAFLRMRFSFPYELPAVVANNYQKGGVQNSSIPNYIYRWDRRSIYQTAAASMPHLDFALHVRQYWDFNVDARELSRRRETRIGSFLRILGPGLFLRGLHLFQAVMNHLPWLPRQGNKFFACITKQGVLKPWIVRDGDRFDFNRHYTTQ
jgi:SAM-dependent methyltransferase